MICSRSLAGDSRYRCFVAALLRVITELVHLLPKATGPLFSSQCRPYCRKPLRRARLSSKPPQHVSSISLFPTPSYLTRYTIEGRSEGRGDWAGLKARDDFGKLDLPVPYMTILPVHPKFIVACSNGPDCGSVSRDWRSSEYPAISRRGCRVET